MTKDVNAFNLINWLNSYLYFYEGCCYNDIKHKPLNVSQKNKMSSIRFV